MESFQVMDIIDGVNHIQSEDPKLDAYKLMAWNTRAGYTPDLETDGEYYLVKMGNCVPTKFLPKKED